MDNSKNLLLLFETHVVEWSDTVKVPFSCRCIEKVFEFCLQYNFLLQLADPIHYVIGPSTLKHLSNHYSTFLRCECLGGSTVELNKFVQYALAATCKQSEQ